MTLMVFLKELFEKDDFEKHQQTTKGMKNYPACKAFANCKVNLNYLWEIEHVPFSYVGLCHMHWSVIHYQVIFE